MHHPADRLVFVHGEEKPPVFLLDAMSFIFRAYHAMQRSRPMSTRIGVPTAATYVFVNMINKLRQDFSAGLLCGCLRRERRGLSRRARPRHATLRKWNFKIADLRRGDYDGYKAKRTNHAPGSAPPDALHPPLP